MARCPDTRSPVKPRATRSRVHQSHSPRSFPLRCNWSRGTGPASASPSVTQKRETVRSKALERTLFICASFDSQPSCVVSTRRIEKKGNIHVTSVKRDPLAQPSAVEKRKKGAFVVSYVTRMTDAEFVAFSRRLTHPPSLIPRVLLNNGNQMHFSGDYQADITSLSKQNRERLLN